MDTNGDMAHIGEDIESGLITRMTEDGSNSRFGIDNLEPVPVDEQAPADESGKSAKKKKKMNYHRHTRSQIQELESVFSVCPHPDKKQRAELSRKLGLEDKQIKFWFQNKRAQMKGQLEHHENVMLSKEGDRLRAENNLLKRAMAALICNNCGGPTVLGDRSYDRCQLRIENARLREELRLLCSMTNEVVREPMSSSPINPLPPHHGFN